TLTQSDQLVVISRLQITENFAVAGICHAVDLRPDIIGQLIRILCSLFGAASAGHAAADIDDLLEQSLGSRGRSQRCHLGTAARLAQDGYIAGVATESRDVVP